MRTIQIFKLFGSILVDDKEAQKSLSRTDKKTKTLGDRLRSGIKTAGKWGAALAAAGVAAGAAMFGLVNKATQAADAIAKGAEKVGMSTDFYQEMEYWASQNGIAHEQMEKALGRFNQRLGQAQNGNEKYSTALKELGIDLGAVESGQLSTEDAFAQSISTLSEMESEQDKVNLATELFGTRMARDLLPALNDGSLSIDEARKKAQELGLVMSEDQLQAAETFQDSWDNIKRSLSTAATQMGLELMPMFQKLLDWVIANLPAIRETFSNVFGFIQTAIGWVTGGIGNIISFLQNWASQNEGVLSGIWEGFQMYLGMLIEYWQSVFGQIKTVLQEALNFIMPFIMQTLTAVLEFWRQNGQSILQNAIQVFNSVKQTIQTALQAAWTIIQQVLQLAIPFIQEKLAVIQQFWQQNGQQIMQAVKNAFSFIQSTIEFVMPAIQLIVQTVWGIIEGLFNGALNTIMGLIKTFSGLFTGDWSKMWEGVKQLLSGALQFIWNLINVTLVGRGIALIKNFASMGLSVIRNLGPNIVSLFRNMVNGAINLIQNLFSRGMSIFRNLSSGIRSLGSRILSAVKKPFQDALSFIGGMGSQFLSAGRNIIDSIVSGIKGAAGKVKSAIDNIVGGIRDFLPFSPAKEGPLKDLDKLDFGGPIEDSIADSEHDVKAKMAHLLTMPEGDSDSADMNNARGDNSGVEQLLVQLIEAVREGKNLNIDGKTFAKVTGDYTDEEGGNRVRRIQRGLAT